jgi:hypothetical protein
MPTLPLGSWVRIPLKAWMFGMCMGLFCVCVVLCLGSGLATGWSVTQGVLPSVIMITELSKKLKPWIGWKGQWKKKDRILKHPAQLNVTLSVTTVVLRRLVAGFQPRLPRFEPRSGHMGFVVDEVALGQVFSEYFGFPCQLSLHRLFHIYYHLLSGAGTIGQIAAGMASELSLTPPQETKKNWCQYTKLSC